uniref:Uncharacterized protein n=1 Tax=Rhizophora mucronata TaxID=61149 RepID=A0A2P2Q7K9_RHIMU
MCLSISIASLYKLCILLFTKKNRREVASGFIASPAGR